jgi:hypothetical protein
MTERSGNIYENKGSALHCPGQSWNVIENTGSYELKAKMLLKRNDVAGGMVGFRSQEKDFEKAPPSPTTVPNFHASLDSETVGNGETKDLVISKTHERRGNLYENKGSFFHSLQQSGNVIENTSSYEFMAGMLLKGQAVTNRLRAPICRGGSSGVQGRSQPRSKGSR